MYRSLGLLLISFLLFSSAGYNQEKYTLKINTFTIEINGLPVPMDTSFQIHLLKDIPREITIYKDNDLKYIGVFTFKRSKNRLKFIRRFYAIKGVDKPVKSKAKKDVQYIKIAIPGKFIGKSSEHLVVNKDNLESIFVSFNYEFIYQLNFSN